MVATSTSFHSYKYLQTTDGTNDYYSGINGTNSFAISTFAGLTGMTFSVLINLPVAISAASTQRRLLEISDSTRTNLVVVDIGAFSGLLTNEYIGTTLTVGPRASGRQSAVETIATGWRHVTVTTGGGSSSFITIDGVGFTATDGAGGQPLTATSTITVNKLGLMASSIGGVPTGCEWREALLLNTALPVANMQALYQYYTHHGNVSIQKTARTAWRFYVTPSGRSQIVALWKGNESGTNLLDSKTSTSNLVKTNF